MERIFKYDETTYGVISPNLVHVNEQVHLGNRIGTVTDILEQRDGKGKYEKGKRPYWAKVKVIIKAIPK